LIGSGGFSLIYLAEDLDGEGQVVIKEFLPKKLATRSDSVRVHAVNEEHVDSFNHSRKMFFQEAKVLAMLKHPNIVNVRNFCLANNTAYLIMDYERGRNLSSYIRERHGRLSATFIESIFLPLLDALNLIHAQSLMHLDIKPSNIHIRSGGNPLLLDFGAVHQLSKTRRTLKGRIITPGFSPVEQYYASGYVGPWSDIYAVGATIRACMDGKPPPSAVQRHAKDTLRPAATALKKRYPKHMLDAVDWAMEVDALLRPQNVQSFLEVFLHKKSRQQVQPTANTSNYPNENSLGTPTEAS